MHFNLIVNNTYIQLALKYIREKYLNNFCNKHFFKNTKVYFFFSSVTPPLMWI